RDESGRRLASPKADLERSRLAIGPVASRNADADLSDWQLWQGAVSVNGVDRAKSIAHRRSQALVIDGGPERVADRCTGRDHAAESRCLSGWHVSASSAA